MGKNKNKGNNSNKGKKGNKENKQHDSDNENELIELAISENAKLPKPEYVKIIPPKDNKYPFVSVCTPTFNRRPFIPAMMKCFNHQTYPKHRMEWIIIDDGTDKIGDLVQHIPQVKYLKNCTVLNNSCLYIGCSLFFIQLQLLKTC